MATLSESLHRQFHFFDVLLFAAGLSLLSVYFVVLPAQHPDSAAGTTLTEESAADRAEQFVLENGFILSSDLSVEARQARDVRLLDSLQATYGRPHTVRLLRNAPNGPLPAFYWQVEWNRASNEGEALLRADLGLDGRPYAFHSDPMLVPVRRVNRQALARVLLADAAELEAGLPSTAISDSTLTAMLSFDLGEGGAQQPDSAEAAPIENGPMGRVAGDQPISLREALLRRPALSVGLREGAAAAMARFHLERTLLSDLPLRVDSVRAVSRAGGSAASVYLQSTEPYYGQTVRVRVDVSATGGLLALQPEFNPVAEAPRTEATTVGEESQISFAVTSSSLADVVMGLLFVALVLMALFMFIRRLNARVIDTKTALRDALWAGVFVGSLVLVTSAEALFREVSQVWLAFVLLSANVSISGLGGAFVVFLASGAMDSLARSVWADKLSTLGLIRHSVFRNVPVGAALLRGVSAGFVLAGGTTLLLAFLPDAGINYSDDDRFFEHTYMLSTVVYAFAKNAWLGQFLSFTVLLGVGSLLYRVKKSVWVVVTGLTVVLLITQVPPFQVEPVSSFAVISGAVGFVLAYTFWRYDMVTAFTAFLVFGLLWDTQNGWMVPDSPILLDAVLAFVTVGVALVVGLVGTFSRRTETELPTYMPSYIQELAQEERLKGELEIAYEVQASFLPRHMPKVPGVDLAAMCLPALEIGGDYYDFVELEPGRLAVVVGDVSGKGIQAAFYMTLVKGFFQSLCRMVDSPAELLRRLNLLFCANVPRGTFISMIYGVLDVEARTFTFARAGHNPVILKRSPSQDPELYRPNGMGIGLVTGPRFDATIAEETLHLRPGDVLVFYTDGFSEAMNARKELYGDDRLAQRVSEVGQRTANEILRSVSEDVHHFMEAAGRHDDMTMVVIKLRGRPSYTPGPTATQDAIAEQYENGAA